MNDKRRQKRRHLIYYLGVHEHETGRYIGKMVDITTEGLMIISETPFPVDTEVRLEMKLPEKQGQREVVLFTARSTYCKPDINPKYYNIGFQFLDISRKDIDTIEQLVFNYAFLD